MQEEDNRSWRIEVRAKAKNFNFKFKATKTEPNWKTHRLSLLLKLRRFFLRVNSDSTDSKTRRPTLIPKFLRISTKPRSKSTNNRKPKSKFGLERIQQYAKEARHCCGDRLWNHLLYRASFLCLNLVFFLSFFQGPINLGALVVVLVGFMLQHIAVVVKKLVARKLWLLLVASMAALAWSVVVVDLGSCLKFGRGLYSSSKFVWSLWNYFGSFICDKLWTFKIIFYLCIYVLFWWVLLFDLSTICVYVLIYNHLC